MLLFSRRRTLNPARSRAAMAFAVEVAGRAREVIGHDVYAWTTVFSPEAGTLVWSARMESITDIETSFDKMGVANEYMDFVEGAEDLFVGGVTDSLVQVVHGTPDTAPAEYVQIVQAQCLPGKLSGAMAFGMEVADAVTRVTGRSCLFCAGMTGPWGGVGWLTGAADAAAFEATNDTWSNHADAIAIMDRAGDFYQPNASTTVLRRLA